MPSGLQRFQQTRQGHFLTWSCYQRRSLLAQTRRRDWFLSILEQVRRRYRFVVMGYVVMPEHVHLLISEPERGSVASAIQVLKQRTARRLQPRRRQGQTKLWDEDQHLWQKRYYDFNVWSARKRLEKLHYMHQNPVRRGLVQSPELWVWSSYRAYAFGEAGPVKLNDWPEIWLSARLKTGKVEGSRTHPSKTAKGGAPTLRMGYEKRKVKSGPPATQSSVE
ncbi:MAG: REP-associated tyrosine transposase [Terriglobales bacterium]